MLVPLAVFFAFQRYFVQGLLAGLRTLTGHRRPRRRARWSSRAARNACQPGIPLTPPPAWVAEDPWYRPGIGRAVVGVTGRRSHVEQLIHGQFAVEDVAADQAELLLHVVRPDHLAVDHGVAEVRRQRGVAVDRAVGVGLQLLAVGLLVPLVRHPLLNIENTCTPSGRQSLSIVVGIAPSTNGPIAAPCSSARPGTRAPRSRATGTARPTRCGGPAGSSRGSR